MKKYLTILVLLFGLYIAVIAEEKKEPAKDEWKFSGQVSFRPELDGRDFSNKTYPLMFTSLRTRLGVEKLLFNNTISVFAQLQDSRVFGEEPSPTASIKNTDLHQGYVTLRNLFDLPIWVQAGRFEVEYGSQRFFGSSQWGYTSRSFDGFRFGYKAEKLFFDLFGYTLAFTRNYISTPKPEDNALYPYPSQPDPAFTMYGFWGKYKLIENHALDLFAYYEHSGKKSDTLHDDLSRLTGGFNYELKIGNFSALAEFGLQVGNASIIVGKKYTKFYNVKGVSDKAIWIDSVNKKYVYDTTSIKITPDSTKIDIYGNKAIQAYTASLKLRYTFGEFYIGLQADMMSGNKNNDNNFIRLYNSDYATKHGVYGFMDYFDYDVNKSTLGSGVNDYFLSVGYNQKDGPWTATLDCHYFMANQEYVAVDTKTKAETKYSVFGEEFDLVVKYKLYSGATFEWGGSAFLPGDLMKKIYTINEGKANEVKRTDPAFWSYIMLRVNM